MSAVPPASELREGLCEPVQGGHGAATWPIVLGQSAVRGRSLPPRPETGSPDPAPDRRTHCKHSAPAASLSGEEGARRSRGPTFLRLLSRTREKATRAEGRKAAAAIHRRPAACARVRGREGSPGAPPAPAGSRPRPAPAYLPGSLRRLAPRAPS